jgi:hypothetical protein
MQRGVGVQADTTVAGSISDDGWLDHGLQKNATVSSMPISISAA